MEEQLIADRPQSRSNALIVDTFTKLRKWREEQAEEFRKKQLQESEKCLLNPQRFFQQLLEKSGESAVRMAENASLPEEIVPQSNHSLSESSITGHLLNCFSNTSSYPSLNESNNIFKNVVSPSHLVAKVQNLIASSHASHSKQQDIGNSDLATKKPCRPFLKKGSGLARYMPKAAKKECSKATRKEESPTSKTTIAKTQKPYPCAQQNLKLKPIIRSDPVEKVKLKHIRFDEQDLETVVQEPVVRHSATNLLQENQKKQSEEYKPDLNERSTDDGVKDSHEPDFIDLQDTNLVDEKNTSTNSLNLVHEFNELAEFELLENCANNSSFNSDSSVAQRVISGEKQKCFQPSLSPLNLIEKMSDSLPSAETKDFKENCFAAKEIVLSNGLSEESTRNFQTRKQQLQKMISDINPRIVSLQKEIACNKDIFEDEDSDMSERCSTPNLDSEPGVNVLENPLENYDQNDLSFESTNEAQKDIAMCPKDCSGFLSADDVPPESETQAKQSNFEQEKIINRQRTTELLDKSQTSIPLKLKEKFLELEKEINTYQELNAKQAQLCKEREEIVKKLRKEREDFQKYKEEEKKKLQLELEENHRQMKRQKETFLRFQKLRQDNPLKKEREAMATLRQEVTKLQEALSSLKIKYNNDTKKLKNKLVIIEKERDNFKMENIRLDDQCQDLLSALKERNKKLKQAFVSKKCHNLTVSDSPEKCVENDDDEKYPKLQNKDQYDKADEELQVRKSVMRCNDLNSKSSGSKLRVRFDLPEYQTEVQSEDSEAGNDDDEGFEVNMNDEANEVRIDVNDHLVDETENNVNDYGDDDATCNSGYKVGDESEPFREENVGDKIQRIYVSGKEEFLYPNGTRKVIDAAKKCITVFFYNGDRKEVYPDKKEVYKYANGTVELSLPDGVQRTEYPNGQIQMLFPDGKKWVKFEDGTAHTMHSDGSEEIRFPEGTRFTCGADGTETIEYANGQREVRTDTYKMREFPDGSLKIVYPSGRQETRYSDGRVRIKNKEGKVILDTKYVKEKSKGLESKYLEVEKNISIWTYGD